MTSDGIKLLELNENRHFRYTVSGYEGVMMHYVQVTR
jgi:hypothetical protein